MADLTVDVGKAQMRRYAMTTSTLIILLGGMLFLLYLFSRPPEFVGAEKASGYNHELSIYGFEGDRLNKPLEVAVAANGDIYVADSNKHRIVVFNSEGEYITRIGNPGDGRTDINFPTAVAVAPDGRVYVASKTQNKIVIYSKEHKPVWVIDVQNPLALSIKDKRLYVTTSRGIMIGALDGSLITSFGSRGAKKGSVDMPTGIAVDDKSNIYVADSMNYRIQAFDKEGKSLWTLGKAPDKKNAIKSAERDYGLPVGMAIDEHNYLYFMDAFAGEIVTVSPSGKEVSKVGAWGKNDGQYFYPGGLAYAGDRKFVVADKTNDRVQIVTIPSPVPPTIAEYTVRYSLPVLAVLGTIALLIGWLLKSRRRVAVLDNTFLDKAIALGSVSALKDQFDKLFVTSETYELYKDKTVEDIKLDSLLSIIKKGRQPGAIKDLGLKNKSHIEALTTAIKYGGKATLLTNDTELEQLASYLKMTVLSNEELAKLISEAETS